MKTGRFKVAFAPHIVSEENVSSIMYNVIVALLPAVIISVLSYGIYVFFQYVVGVVSAVFFEWIFCRLQGKPTSTKDLSSVVTGILLVMCLPPSLPLWMTIIGAFSAIVIGKMVYGGLGQNPFNPALVGRMVLLISFTSQMTYWVLPNNFLFSNPFFVDSISGATVLNTAKTVYTTGIFDNIPIILPTAWFNSSGGSIGEVSSVALICGGIYLIYKRVISWRIPFYFISTVFFVSGAIWLFNRGQVLDPFTQVFGGGLILGAFFMATDYSSSPLYNKGKVIFAIGCGVITVMIRLYGGYPEGVGFSILIMNAFVPLLDKLFVPVSFGADHE